MSAELTTQERRIKILELIVMRKYSTRKELSNEFHVSTDTIDRDIDYLTHRSPIYTRQGNHGGIYIDKDYKFTRNFLTMEEEACLRDLMEQSSPDEKRIVNGIIMKFSANGF